MRYTDQADDVDPGKHYLELSNRETAMVERVTSEFDNVIVVINSSNAMELGWLEQYSSIKAYGVYAYMKHFVLNDQETNRADMLCTWSNEQAIREIYLKPFEMCVKDAGCEAVMSSYNYIGTRWASATPELLNNVLRGEWGFTGMVYAILNLISDAAFYFMLVLLAYGAAIKFECKPVYYRHV